MVSSILNYKKEKIIQYIEENGLPVVNIFKADDDCTLEQEHTLTPRFQDAPFVPSKISTKEVAA